MAAAAIPNETCIEGNNQTKTPNIWAFMNERRIADEINGINRGNEGIFYTETFKSMIDNQLDDPYPVRHYGIKITHHSLTTSRQGTSSRAEILGGWYINLSMVNINNKRRVHPTDQLQLIDGFNNLHISIHLNPIPRQSHIKFNYSLPNGKNVTINEDIYFYLDTTTDTIKICDYVGIANNLVHPLIRNQEISTHIVTNNIVTIFPPGIDQSTYIFFLIKNAFIKLLMSFQDYINYFYRLAKRQPIIYTANAINHYDIHGTREADKMYKKYLKYKNKYLKLKKMANKN